MPDHFMKIGYCFASYMRKVRNQLLLLRLGSFVVMTSNLIKQSYKQLIYFPEAIKSARKACT